MNSSRQILDIAQLHSGDVYSLLIEFSFMNGSKLFLKLGNFHCWICTGDKQTCHDLLEEMDKKGLPIELYVEETTIKVIYLLRGFQIL